ncbi:MAG: hypothetical protein GF344_03095 [Chitinivibrionales bacterium]|nr:hypothetical protein [Chitinivibrionales bacterium]
MVAANHRHPKPFFVRPTPENVRVLSSREDTPTGMIARHPSDITLCGSLRMIESL